MGHHLFSRYGACLSAGVLAFAAGSASADEGMWTFDNFPVARVNAAYGTNIDQAWLDRVRAASVRIPSCSGSVVSGQGLIMSNYHCVQSCADAVSTPQQDYLSTGYLTATREEEKVCPGFWAEVLTEITDVTARINTATQGLSGSALGERTARESADIQAETCQGETGVRCQVLTLYGGGQYKLYKFRRHEDIRLVFAPEFDTGFFGGDPDNFNFPRYNLDIGFLRIYENGAPLATPEHLTWNPAPPRDGEPIFLPGNPGATQRLLTNRQLEFLRDVSLPATGSMTSELRGRMYQYSLQSEAHRREVYDTLAYLENTYKVTTARAAALRDPEFFGVKVAQEQDLRRRVAADAALAAEIGDPWAEIDRAYDAYEDIYPTYYFLSSNAGGGSTLFNLARALVRAAIEREKPAAERLAGYQDSQLAGMRAELEADEPTNEALERLYLTHWLLKAREKLTADDPVTRLLLGRESPESKTERLLSGTRLRDPAARLALYDGGVAAIRASDDPMIQLALAIDPDSRTIAGRFAQEVTGPTTQAQARLNRARFAVYGDEQYPDATFSLRLTYGQVRGWTERGREITPFTTLAGLYERDTGERPYDLPDSWGRARDRVDMSTVFNFAGTGDVVGGASGSPTLNANAEVIGAVFDGNIHSNGGAYGYDLALNRSVHVAASGIQEALLKVYGREALVAELNAR